MRSDRSRRCPTTSPTTAGPTEAPSASVTSPSATEMTTNKCCVTCRLTLRREKRCEDIARYLSCFKTLVLKNIVLKCAEDVFLYLCGRFIPYLRLADGCLVCDCRSAWWVALALVRARWFKLSSAWLNLRPDRFSSMTSTRQRSVFTTSAETSQSFPRFGTKSSDRQYFDVIDSLRSCRCCKILCDWRCRIRCCSAAQSAPIWILSRSTRTQHYGSRWNRSVVICLLLSPLSLPSSTNCHCVIPLSVRHEQAAVVSGEDEAGY